MLQQYWAMFARPTRSRYWYVAKARLADGTWVDLLRDGQPVDLRPPKRPGDVFRNHRWRKLFSNLVLRRFQPLREGVADYLVREFNARQPESRRVVLMELLLCAYQLTPEHEEGEFQSEVFARIESGDQIEKTLDFDLPY